VEFCVSFYEVVISHVLICHFLSFCKTSRYNAAPRHGAVGLGGTISGSLSQYLRRGMPFTSAGTNKSSGNGSIMRLASIPIRFHEDVDVAMEKANKQSRTTHQAILKDEYRPLIYHIYFLMMVLIVCRVMRRLSALD